MKLLRNIIVLLLLPLSFSFVFASFLCYFWKGEFPPQYPHWWTADGVLQKEREMEVNSYSTQVSLAGAVNSEFSERWSSQKYTSFLFCSLMIVSSSYYSSYRTEISWIPNTDGWLGLGLGWFGLSSDFQLEKGSRERGKERNEMEIELGMKDELSSLAFHSTNNKKWCFHKMWI